MRQSNSTIKPASVSHRRVSPPLVCQEPLFFVAVAVCGENEAMRAQTSLQRSERRSEVKTISTVCQSAVLQTGFHGCIATAIAMTSTSHRRQFSVCSYTLTAWWTHGTAATPQPVAHGSTRLCVQERQRGCVLPRTS